MKIYKIIKVTILNKKVDIKCRTRENSSFIQVYLSVYNMSSYAYIVINMALSEQHDQANLFEDDKKICFKFVEGCHVSQLG